MKETSPGWLLALLLAACFTLATVFVPRASWWNEVPGRRTRIKTSRRRTMSSSCCWGRAAGCLATRCFAMADAYFHSGYYPSIFDQPVTEADVAERSDEGKGENQDATSDDFFGPPPDWIAALDRQFVPNQHTHLDSGGAAGNMKSAEVQEILPWLKLATDMNPQYDRCLSGRLLLAATGSISRQRPGSFCWRDCVIIPATVDSCSTWVVFIRTSKIQIVPVTSGRPLCGAGRRR